MLTEAASAGALAGGCAAAASPEERRRENAMICRVLFALDARRRFAETAPRRDCSIRGSASRPIARTRCIG